MAASQTLFVLLQIVSIESFMLGSQFNASKTRKISIPCLADSRMKASTALSGYAEYPTPLDERNSIWKQIFGMASLRSCSRVQGSSRRNRMDTSNVAPPHISTL